MDETDYLTSRTNEFSILLDQLGDIDAKLSAGIISQVEYTEAKARKLAYTSALAKLAEGEEVDEGVFADILADMRAVAAAPTQEEINAANIDYLLMIGGEE